jgi:hypothetical protein
MDWTGDSSSKVPALQVQSPEYKPSPTKTNKEIALTHSNKLLLSIHFIFKKMKFEVGMWLKW